MKAISPELAAELSGRLVNLDTALNGASLGWARSPRDYGAVGDGVTDDTEALQACIDAGPGAIGFPWGTYLHSDTLYVNSDRNLLGFGGSLKAAPSIGNRPMVQVNSAQARVVAHGLVLDGNMANRPAGDEDNGHGICVYGAGAPTFPVTDVMVRDCRIFNVPSIPVFGSYFKRVSITGNHIHDCRRGGPNLYFNSSELVISGNLIERTGDDAIALNSQEGGPSSDVVRNFSIVGNVIRDQVGPYGQAIKLRGCQYGVVSGNTILNTWGDAIVLGSVSQTPLSDVSITDNIIVGAGLNHSQADDLHGIRIQPNYGPYGDIGVGIRRVRIAGNTIVRPSGFGIIVESNGPQFPVDDLSIIDNTIDVAGSLMPNSAGIIFWQNGGALSPAVFKRPVVRGNRLLNSRTSGLWMHTAMRPEVADNIAEDNGTHGIYLQNLADPIVRGNRCHGSPANLLITGTTGTLTSYGNVTT